MNMTEIQVLTESCATINIQVEQIDDFDFRVLNTKTVSCLVCQNNGVPLEVIPLAFTKELQKQLENFGFPASQSDNVVLCGSCIEEIPNEPF